MKKEIKDLVHILYLKNKDILEIIKDLNELQTTFVKEGTYKRIELNIHVDSNGCSELSHGYSELHAEGFRLENDDEEGAREFLEKEQARKQEIRDRHIYEEMKVRFEGGYR